MKIGQTIQCQACGASSVIKHPEKSLLECQYCGAMMAFSESTNHTSSGVDQNQPAKIGLMLLVLPVVVIILMVVLWLGFQNSRKHIGVETVEDEFGVVAEQRLQGQSRVPSDPSVTTITPGNSLSASDNNAIPVSQNLKIESQVSGITSNGGKYWIFSIINTGAEVLARPGVMVSLFNQTGKRLVEQGGWSLKEFLQPEEQTTVLVFLSELPEDAIEQQVTTLASQPSRYALKQVSLKVEDYNINTQNNRHEIIGDVVNDQASSVKFTRVVAVAYNAAKEPIGIGNAFSTVKDLVPKQSSGFKIRVSTFLTDVPNSWQVWAVARAQ